MDAKAKETLEKILGKHGVLTHDGWEFVTDDLINDLLKWRTDSQPQSWDDEEFVK